MALLVISTSLDPSSRSRLLARHAHERLRRASPGTAMLDLAECDPPLPMCDATSAYEHPSVAGVKRQIAGASGVLLALPVYNFAAGATAKNLIELTGDAWEGKVVGIAAAAGGPNAFMAPMSIAMCLMLDFRCIVIPRFVYATSEAFDAGAVTDDDVRRRLDQLADELARVSAAINHHPGGG